MLLAKIPATVSSSFNLKVSDGTSGKKVSQSYFP